MDSHRDFAALAKAASVDSHYVMGRFSDGYQYLHGINSAFQKDNAYTLFRWEDATAWIVFTCVFAVLIIFDNVVLHRGNKALSMMTACLYTLFWVFCAGLFCLWIWHSRGPHSAFNWMSGYLLEWMLSFDNLFVFHMIFSAYGTPDNLKHRPLFLGICGAVFFRLIFLFIGEWMMHAMFFAHFIFGAFLVWTGFKSAMWDDDDEDDPSHNPIVQWLSRTLPFVSAYDAKGSFFVKVPVDRNGRLILPEGVSRISDLPAEESGAEESGEAEESTESRYGTVAFSSFRAQQEPAVRYRWRATMLLLVVICLEISDILFAVDSVSAIVAQVPDLFLAYTSAIFAMLGLRAMFFIIDVLVKLFTLLKYGVSAVLIFVGIKLILSHMVHIPPGLVCLVLFLTLGASMVASVIQDYYLRRVERIEATMEAAREAREGKQAVKSM